MNSKDSNPFISLLIVVTTILLVSVTVILIIRLNQNASPESGSANPTSLVCGESCGDNIDSECGEGLLCVDGVCKNPNCPESSNCLCTNDNNQGEDTTEYRCNVLCGGTYGDCPTQLECVNSEGNSSIGIGRCRDARCPKDLDCFCN